MSIIAMIPVTSLFLFTLLPFSSAEFPTPVLPPPLPMEKYQVDNGGGDESCPASVNMNELQQARRMNMARYSALKEAESFKDFDAGMREIWDVEDEDIKVIIPTAGTYSGIEEVIEYISLVVGSLNGGFAYYYSSVLSELEYFQTNSSYAFQAAQKSQFYCSSLPSADDPGNCETGELDSLSLHHITWKPCSNLIKQYVIQYDRQQDYLALKGGTPATICSRHERYCTGENKQYRDFMDCMSFMESIPSVTCGTNYFNGDSSMCRFKHSFMIPFRPDIHCPHVGKDTYVCTDEDCDGDFRACEAVPGDVLFTGVLHPRCSKKCNKSTKKSKKTNAEEVNTSRCANTWTSSAIIG